MTEFDCLLFDVVLVRGRLPLVIVVGCVFALKQETKNNQVSNSGSNNIVHESGQKKHSI